MPKYGLPGVAANPKSARTTGAVAVAVIAVLVLVNVVSQNLSSEEGLRITLHTEQVGGGLSAGSDVRVDGVRVGEIAKIVPADRGTQRITLQLDDSQLFGIDDSLGVDYAAGNLFGISELELRRGPGGSPLRAGSVIDLTGPRADDVYDATMGAILRSLSQVGATVFTPQVATVIAQVATDVQAFTPLLQALITVARTIADNQTMPASELVGNLGPAFDGGGEFAGATMQVLSQIRDIDILKTDREHFDVGVTALHGQILPALAATLGTAGKHLGDGADMLAPILSLLAQTVPRPQQSGTDLRALLTRLNAAMPATPTGPMLNLEVDLAGMPGIAVPLLRAGGVR